MYMPAPQSGSPMTYMLNGRQYLVLAISGNGVPGELIAFRLPQADNNPPAGSNCISNCIDDGYRSAGHRKTDDRGLYPSSFKRQF